MKKNINKTTVIVVLAIFLKISVGYALFSDTITIEGTATAQGNFDISVTCQKGYSQEFIELNEFETNDPDIYQSGFYDDSCIVSGDSVSASVAFENPGSARAFTINIKNTGTIDAYWKLDSELQGPAVLDEKFVTTELTNISTGEVTSKTYSPYENIKENEELKFYRQEFPSFTDFMVIVKLANGRYTNGFEYLDNGESLDESLFYVDSNEKYYFKLAPNNSIISVVAFGWDDTASTQGYSSKTTFTMPFDFIQKTSDMELAPDADGCIAGC